MRNGSTNEPPPLDIDNWEPEASQPVGRLRTFLTTGLVALVALGTAVHLANRKPRFDIDDPKCLVVAERVIDVVPLRHGKAELELASDAIAATDGDVSLAVNQMIADREWSQLAATVKAETRSGGEYDDARPVEPGRWGLPKGSPIEHKVHLGALTIGTVKLLLDLGVFERRRGIGIDTPVPGSVLSRLAVETKKPELLVIAAEMHAVAGEVCLAQELLSAAKKQNYPEAFLNEAVLLADSGQIEAARRAIDAVPDHFYPKSPYPIARHPGPSIPYSSEDDAPGKRAMRNKWSIKVAIEEKLLGDSPRMWTRPADSVPVQRILEAHDKLIANYPSDVDTIRSAAVRGNAMVLARTGRWKDAIDSITNESNSSQKEFFIGAIADVGFFAAVDQETGIVLHPKIVEATVEAMQKYVIDNDFVTESADLVIARIYADAAHKAHSSGKQIETWQSYSRLAVIEASSITSDCLKIGKKGERFQGSPKKSATEWCVANGFPTGNPPQLNTPDPARARQLPGWTMTTPSLTG